MKDIVRMKLAMVAIPLLRAQSPVALALKTATPLFRDGARLRLHGCPAAESWKYCGEKLYSEEQCGIILLTLSRKLEAQQETNLDKG